MPVHILMNPGGGLDTLFDDFLVSFWVPFGSLGVPLASLGLPLDRLWSLLGVFWIPFSPFRGVWVPRACFWFHLGSFCEPFVEGGSMWDIFGNVANEVYSIV